MSVLVGKKAPLSQSQAVLANGEIIDDFHLGQTISGKYAALFFSVGFHVCPSEIIAFANRTPALKALNCEVVAVSTDSHHTHSAWRNTPVDQGGIGPVPFPPVGKKAMRVWSIRLKGLLITSQIMLHCCDTLQLR